MSDRLNSKRQSVNHDCQQTEAGQKADKKKSWLFIFDLFRTDDVSFTVVVNRILYYGQAVQDRPIVRKEV